MQILAFLASFSRVLINFHESIISHVLKIVQEYWFQFHICMNICMNIYV